MKGERGWKAAALGLAVLAVAASLNAVLSAPRHQEVLARKEADLRKIQAQAGRWAREDALRNMLEARQAWTPAALEELAIRALGVDVAKITPRPATPMAVGDVLKQFRQQRDIHRRIGVGEFGCGTDVVMNGKSRAFGPLAGDFDERRVDVQPEHLVAAFRPQLGLHSGATADVGHV